MHDLERSHVLAVVLRFRFALCVALAVVVALEFNHAPADAQAFASEGARLMDGRWRNLYSSGWLQAGPLQILTTRVLMLGSSGQAPLTAVVIACDVSLVVLAMCCCPRAPRLHPADRQRRQLLVGLLMMLWVAAGGLWAGHPVELAIPLLWMLGLRAAAQDRPIRSVVLVGAAGAFAPWAVLALPAFVGVARPVRAALLACGAATVTVACYLPWVFAGTFNMFGHIWPVVPGSGPQLLDGTLLTFDWRLRVLQGAIVGAGTVATAVALRGRRELVPVAAPLATALLRVVTDPLTIDYYWISIGALAIVALIWAPATRSFLTADARLVLLPYLCVMAVVVHHKPIGALIVLLVAVTLIPGLRRATANSPATGGSGDVAELLPDLVAPGPLRAVQRRVGGTVEVMNVLGVSR